MQPYLTGSMIVLLGKLMIEEFDTGPIFEKMRAIYQEALEGGLG